MPYILMQCFPFGAKIGGGAGGDWLCEGDYNPGGRVLIYV